jgi:hypothetical protein
MIEKRKLHDLESGFSSSLLDKAKRKCVGKAVILSSVAVATSSFIVSWMFSSTSFPLCNYSNKVQDTHKDKYADKNRYTSTLSKHPTIRIISFGI